MSIGEKELHTHLCLRLTHRRDTRSICLLVMAGAWFGNDTLWRTILDLNRIALYADKQGTLQPHPQRTIFTIVDGIVAGEGNGPIDPMPVHLGMLMGGVNSVAVDLCGSVLMGVDYRKILHLVNALGRTHRYPLFDLDGGAVKVSLNGGKTIPLLDCVALHLFRPPDGWIGQIEKMEVPPGLQGERVEPQFRDPEC